MAYNGFIRFTPDILYEIIENGEDITVLRNGESVGGGGGGSSVIFAPFSFTDDGQGNYSGGFVKSFDETTYEPTFYTYQELVDLLGSSIVLTYSFDTGAEIYQIRLYEGVVDAMLSETTVSNSTNKITYKRYSYTNDGQNITIMVNVYEWSVTRTG